MAEYTHCLNASGVTEVNKPTSAQMKALSKLADGVQPSGKGWFAYRMAQAGWIVYADSAYQLTDQGLALVKAKNAADTNSPFMVQS